MSKLDGLPPELFHDLFSYFSVSEIFYSFTNVSSYVDTVLMGYRFYRINFKGISRHHFDLICRYLVPSRVVALTLSDDEDTPGLIGLFLSRFQIHQFTHLQTLTLIEKGPQFWMNIIKQLGKLKYLRSFSFFPANRNDDWVSNMLVDNLAQFDQVLFEAYAAILPQLQQLKLFHGDLLSSLTFPHLRHLTLEQTTASLMKHISVVAPQLKSFDTRLSLDTEMNFAFPQVRRLILRIYGKCLSVENIVDSFKFQDVWISMNKLEQMISNFPHLRHLQLITMCTDDAIDGTRWQTKVQELITFKFIFYIDRALEPEELDSFRTAFWLNEKRWYVAYADDCLFSVPHLATTEAGGYFIVPEFTTAPDNEIFYRNCYQLSTAEIFEYEGVRFPDVHTLVLEWNPSVFIITEMIDLFQIRNLTLYSLPIEFSITVLIDAMPNLCQLSIGCALYEFLKQCRTKIFYKIRTITITVNSICGIAYIVKRLGNSFPHIEHLHIKCFCAIQNIFDYIHRFQYLSTASFRFMGDSMNSTKQRFSIQSILRNIRGVQGPIYTYRFDSSSIYMWISSPLNSSPSIEDVQPIDHPSSSVEDDTSRPVEHHDRLPALKTNRSKTCSIL